LGYDQWLSVTILKEGCDINTIMVALGLSFPGIIEQIKDCEYYTKENEADFHFETSGRHIYDGTGLLFEEFSAQEISEKLGCTVEVYYEGEDKEDTDSLEYVDGKITKHRQLRWVDVLEENWMIDDKTRKWIVSMAYTVFNNDGIEEFVPELESFSMEAITMQKGEMRDLPDKKLVKVATHAAFVAMLGGFKVDEAVDIVLKNRDDILTAVLEDPND